MVGRKGNTPPSAVGSEAKQPSDAAEEAANAEAWEALRYFGELLPKLWDIALGEASHEKVSTRSMFLVAVSFLNGTDDCTRFLCESGLRRAYEEDDRQELAKETLKVIRCVLGWSALDVELEISDQRRAFSQIRAKVPLPQLKEALNAPGIQHLTARDRAETLSKQGYGTTGAIERRARRLRKRRAPRKGTRSSS